MTINQRRFEWKEPTSSTSDVQLALDCLNAKFAVRKLAWKYYDGDHPTRLSTEKLQRVFEKAGMQLVINWMAVVVDAVNDRMELETWSVSESDDNTKLLNDIWSQESLNHELDEALLDMLVSGEGYLLGDVFDKKVVAYYNPSYQVHMFYDPQYPNRKRMAAKVWEDADGYRHLQLFYTKKLEHYRTKRTRSKEETEAKFGLKADEYELQAGPGTAANNWNIIPVWHFSASRSRARPSFAQVTSIQDAVNKTLSDMVATAEFNAFALKWIIANADVDTGADGEDSLKVPGMPWSIFFIPPAAEGEQQSQAGEWSQGSLADYLAAMDHLALAISSITRTPRHYFTGVAGDPSGEALQAQEAPLTRKVRRYIRSIVPEVQSFGAWVLRVMRNQDVEWRDVEPMFADVRTVQAQTEAEVLNSKVQSGIPLLTLLRDAGWTKEDLIQLEEDYVKMAEMKEGVSPEAAQARMEQAQEKVATELRELAVEAMEAVRDGAMEALIKTGALDAIVERAAQRGEEQ